MVVLWIFTTCIGWLFFGQNTVAAVTGLCVGLGIYLLIKLLAILIDLFS